MDKIKVENESHLYRDAKTNAIVNTSITEYQNYVQTRKVKEKEVKRIEGIENELNNLKSDINDIKSLLMEIKNGSR